MAAALENPMGASPASVIVMQQRYGNRAVGRLLQREVTDAPSTTTPTRDLNNPRELFKHLSLQFHPDKAKDPNDQAEVAWRTELFKKILAARNDLAALKRLQAEGEALRKQAPTTPEAPTSPTVTPTTTPTTSPTTSPTTTPTTPTTTMSEPSGTVDIAPTTEPSNELTTVESGSDGTLALVTPQVVEQATQPTTPSPEEPETESPTPRQRGTTLRMQSFAHNQKAQPFLKKFMAEQNASRNFNFYFDTSGNRDVYRKYIVDGAPQQVPVPSDVKAKLDGLAHTRSWTAMAPALNHARAANQEIINTQFLPRFEQSPYYDQFKAVAKDRPLLSRALSAFKTKDGQGPKISSFGPQLPRQMALTRRTVALLDRAIDRYSPYFVNGKRTLSTVGLPSSPREVERLFNQGHQRHQRVVAAFTRRYAQDKTFRPTSYGPFFAKLRQFTRLWVEYKALLKR